MHCVFYLRDAGVEGLNGVFEFGFQVRLGLQQLQGGVQRGQRVGFVVFQQVDGALGGINQRLPVGQAAVAGVELGPLVGAGVEFVHLANLPGQALALALQAVLCGLGLGEGLLGLAPGGPQAAECTGVHLGIRVQQAAHSLWTGQALPGVLAVNVQQLLANGAQLLRGGGAAIHPGAAFALCVHGAAQQQGVAGFEPGFVQHGLQARRVVKLGAHIGAGRAFADHASVGARAGHQLQRINQDGFARAGFACQHRKARLQVQLQLADDHKVSENNSLECHVFTFGGAYATPSFQCIFWRRVSK